MKNEAIVSAYVINKYVRGQYDKLALAYELHTWIDALRAAGIEIEYFASRGQCGFIANTPSLDRFFNTCTQLHLGICVNFKSYVALKMLLGNPRKADRYMLKVNRKDGLSQQAKDAYTAIFEARKAA